MNDTAVTHAALKTLEYDDGVLLWGGRKVTEIVDELGTTPCYIYDCARIKARVKAFRKAMPADLKLHYAMKANPMPAVVNYMVKLVDGLDVASAGELQVALESGVAPNDISFAGPGKRDAELKYAAESGITINLESETEMRRLANIGNDIGKRPSVAIRVNPPFGLKTSGMKMGGRPSQFGVDAEHVPAMLTELAALDLDFRGFHVFSGSQNLRAEAVEESMTKTVALVIELAGSTTMDVSFVNLGGGLGIPYFPKEQPINLSEVSDTAHRAVDKLHQGLGTVEIIMELGRYLVGEAGLYVTRVIDTKESRGMRFAVCDGGLHHHLAASGNFGQVIRKNYPVAAVTLTEHQQPVSVVGPLCTPLDLLGDRVTMSVLEERSLVAILQSGAYGKTASPENFLSHPLCLEILV